ncbi:hypothetical protein A3J41_02840 [candidate division TM6 bacterium RIFCSPHIGHO2_12_FULL_38_8]|nr:MAG: hypothetical protein A3J41_02840 [candidate division TM6 bacterium RIFCSPHIGHO2_12_FULL_38_8]
MLQHKQSFDTFVNTQLNPQQKIAVTAKDGSFLVIAGAGSGKTRVITARITNLILNHQVQPSSIIALTFTNKAAQEMQHRIAQFLPDLRIKPTIATFHAYCLKLLKKNAYLQNAAQFSVIDAADAQKLLQSIIKEKGLEKLFNAKQLLSFFSTFKMNDVLKLDAPAWNMHHAQQFTELYNAYEQQKKLSNYLDFDDLLYNTFELFTKNPEFATQHLKNHRHLLVDEYQDTNLIQHALLKQMTLQNKKLTIDSVCAVGDEDQSIYSWRGANVANILEFATEFAGTKKIKLEQNYRSTQQILNVANSVIKHNVNRNHKELWSDNPKKHEPLLLECLSDLQEASLIAQLINLCKEAKSSIAILYRTHYQSRIIEEALIKASIAYKMIGGISFYERKEIKDLLAYLRLTLNPHDRISFFRIINCPARGLGEKFEETFVNLWNQNPFSTWQEVAKMLLEQKQLAQKQATSLEQFLTFFDVAKKEKDQKKVCEILNHFIKQTNYLTYLTDHFEKIEAEEKRENIAEFLRAAAYFDENNQGGLSQFLDEISLMQDLIKQDDSATERVNMMTLHSAKGLEFNIVILVGLEEGLLPSNQSIGQENVEEERRLFYVGITRAREKLLISYSKYRNVFGKLDEQRPSRFLREIPASAVLHQEAAHWSKTSFATFFQEWITGEKNATTQKISIVSTTPETTSTFSTNIKRLQSVKHATFGLGIAHQVEQKGDKIVVTVHFTHHGTKKIESSFLQVV